MCKFITILAACMLGYVLFMHVAYQKAFADVALGYAAGLMVAACAFCSHRFYKKKGEVS